jgi:hypothetical protein
MEERRVTIVELAAVAVAVAAYMWATQAASQAL